MEQEKLVLETEQKLKTLRYEIIDLEQILILITGLNNKSKNDFRHM